MISLDLDRLAGASIPVGTGWLLGSCMEARGKQDLWLRQKPEVLDVLRAQAVIHSVESSNRIEGVSVAADRLRPVVLGEVTPRDRPEEELAGYRRALDWVFSRRREITITPEVIQRLHALAQAGAAGDAGEWKQRDNEIVEILPDGERRVRFVPTSARDTPGAVSLLCRRYRQAVADERVPQLLVVATFVLDLLGIHPFRDGNGRVSRLATTLLLLSQGFEVPRYVSLERLVEERQDEYYGALAASSKGWHEGSNSLLPWWTYFLSVLREGYRGLERLVEPAEPRAPKTEAVRQAALRQAEPFALGDLAAQLPAVSPQLIKRTLGQLQDEGRVRLTGRGRGARWRAIPAEPGDPATP
ncbi:MAG: Fic family protein [Candidatus Latescibacterota bacterium]